MSGLIATNRKTLTLIVSLFGVTLITFPMWADRPSNRFPGKPSMSLFEAAWRADVEQMKSNIFYGADVNIRERDKLGGEWIPLRSAVVGAIDTDVSQSKKDRIKVIELLIDAGADVNATFDFRYGWRISDVAAMAGDIDMVTLLLRRGADLNGRGKDPLHPDKPGNAPLHWAVQYNHIKVAKLLIERGADSNLTGAAGLTPLQLATELQEAKVDDYQSIIDLLNDAANVR